MANEVIGQMDDLRLVRVSEEKARIVDVEELEAYPEGRMLSLLARFPWEVPDDDQDIVFDILNEEEEQ